MSNNKNTHRFDPAEAARRESEAASLIFELRPLPDGTQMLFHGNLRNRKDGSLLAQNGEITVPEGVTLIRESAFLENQDLRSAVIPGSVKEIGFEAFKACFNLKTVILSPGLETIDHGAFAYCRSLFLYSDTASLR